MRTLNSKGITTIVFAVGLVAAILVAGLISVVVSLLVIVGQKGEKGDKGDTGSTGATGPQGPQGIQGPLGIKTVISSSILFVNATVKTIRAKEQGTHACVGIKI